MVGSPEIERLRKGVDQSVRPSQCWALVVLCEKERNQDQVDEEQESEDFLKVVEEVIILLATFIQFLKQENDSHDNPETSCSHEFALNPVLHFHSQSDEFFPVEDETPNLKQNDDTSDWYPHSETSTVHSTRTLTQVGMHLLYFVNENILTNHKQHQTSEEDQQSLSEFKRNELLLLDILVLEIRRENETD